MEMKTILIAHNYTQNSFASMSFNLAHHLAKLGNRVVFISHKPFFKDMKIIKSGKGEVILFSWSSEKRPTSFNDVFWFVKIYLKNGLAKIEIALVKGKQMHDKRATEKDRDWQRDKARIMHK